MKYLIYFLTIIFIAPYSMAQNSQIESFKDSFFHNGDNFFARKSYKRKSLLTKNYQLNFNKFQLEEDLLDSVIYIDDGSTYKEIYSYNENASILERINQKWDDLTGKWAKNTERTYIYSEQENQIIYTFFIGKDDIWNNDFRSISIFTDSGNLLSEIKQRWDTTTNLWFNRFKILRTYDERENVLIEENQFWDRTTNNWVNDERTAYTYDSNSNILSEAKEYWADEWITIILTTNTYDAHQNRITQKKQKSGFDFILKNYQLLTYTYNEKDSLTTLLNQIWDSGIGAWKKASKTSYTYDNNGYKIQTINFLWSTGTESWQNRFRFTYINNQTGMVLIETDDFWNTTSETWVARYRITLTYDITNNLLTECQVLK